MRHFWRKNHIGATDRALAPIAVCERLPNIKGPQAGNLIRLMPWQRCWIKTVDVCMREHRFRHDGNSVLVWCLSNVVGHRDAKDNIFPRKKLPEHKIDAAIALIMALSQQIVRSAQDSLPTIYRDHDLLLW